MQVNLYLLSRIMIGLARLSVEKKFIPEPSYRIFPWFAAILWGFVSWLSEYHQNVLQGSLRSSMNYLIRDSDNWTNFYDFLICSDK
ncbi:unnamed protein product [Anisakis simplex]|uniref:Peroxisomal membrane protein 4 (inferred by orthology to a human protein) n=1 Tax=Anisakis simplex TaxID=6269 RepID=A0A0M3J9M4_ANISI|nr:unnamed protein product [Anisakis simplex]